MSHSLDLFGAALVCGALTLWGCSSEHLARSETGGASGETGGAPGETGGASGGTGGASGGAGGASGGAGGGSDGTGGACNAIAYPGPVLNVFDARTGEPICDPTFEIVKLTDAGATFADAVASSCSSYTCPPSDDDAGAMLCPFYLAGLGYSMNVTVEVSASGYEPIDVPGVSVGRSGCVPPFYAASHLNVSLIPRLADASTGDGASF